MAGHSGRLGEITSRWFMNKQSWPLLAEALSYRVNRSFLINEPKLEAQNGPKGSRLRSGWCKRTLRAATGRQKGTQAFFLSEMEQLGAETLS